MAQAARIVTEQSLILPLAFREERTMSTTQLEKPTQFGCAHTRWFQRKYNIPFDPVEQQLCVECPFNDKVKGVGWVQELSESVAADVS